MRVLLDDTTIDVEPATVARALEVARDRAGREGRIVIDVLGDGASVEQAVLDAPPDDAAGYAELKLVTADARAFVSVTLSDCAPLLDQATDAHERAANALTVGNAEAAVEPLQQALTTWALLRDIVEKSAALISIDPASLPLTASGGGTPRAASTGGEAIARLAALLGEMKTALLNKDHAALSDTLAYDMPELVEAWRALLGAIAAAARPE